MTRFARIIYLLLGCLSAVTVIAAPGSGASPIAVDPDKALAVYSSLNKWKNAGNIYRIGKLEYPDLDLGFNDYLELQLLTSAGRPSPIKIRYGTTDPASSNIFREMVIPADRILNDGKPHAYRLDLGLEKHWRGMLTYLSITHNGTTTLTVNDILTGDTDGDIYSPNLKDSPATAYELSSKHFRFIWNKERQKDGMNKEWAHGCLRNAEECWQLFINKLDLPEPATLSPSGRKYKIQFSCSDGGYSAGNLGLNVDLTGLRVDPPTWVIPHEFMHTCQNFIKKGLNWWDMDETHSDYATELWLQFYGKAFDPECSSTTLNFDRLVNFCLPHGRTYYVCWPIFKYLDENPDNLPSLGNNFSMRMWKEQKEGEFWADTIKRLAPEVNFKDLIGYYARRRNFNYANRPTSDNIERAPLRRRPDDPAWWQVPSEMAPMQMGFVVHELVPEDTGASRTVTVNFRGLPNSERGADWRASLTAIATNGTERYSRLWNSGENSIKLEKGENRILLTVAGTPDKIEMTNFDDVECPYRIHPGKARLHYEIQIKGAIPFEPSRPQPVDWHEHPNGGGKVENSAKVDTTAYIGPNAQALNNARVSGHARIEDFAVVSEDAKVGDNAIISGHAMVRGYSMVRNYAKIRDYTYVNDAIISDHARILEHATVNGAAIRDSATVKGRAEQWKNGNAYVGGDAVLDGDHADGNKVINGFHYGHIPWAGNMWITKRKAPRHIYAAYEFDMQKDTIIQDAWGTTDGFVRGNPIWTEKDTIRSGFITLNGENDYVVMDRQLTDFRELTITAWVKWASGRANQPIWFFGSDRETCMWITPDDGMKRARFIMRKNSTLKTLFHNRPLPAGVWTHIAVTLDGKKGNLYINGTLACQAPIETRPDELLPPNLNTTLNHCYLGRSSDPLLTLFRGSLDSIRFYSKALTSKEISSVLAQQKSAD